MIEDRWSPGEDFENWARSVGQTLDELFGPALAHADELPELSPAELRGAFLALHDRQHDSQDGQVASRGLTCGAVATALGRRAGFKADRSREAMKKASHLWELARQGYERQLADLAEGAPSRGRLAAVAGTLKREARLLDEAAASVG